MSFSYKTLNSTDITLTSYIANKQWEVKNSALSLSGVTVYIGENSPLTTSSPFDPINNVQTSNEEYRRLIYQSIKHLYYQNYISGSSIGQFFNSSSYFNYEQSTLVSGTIRNLTTSTSSIFNVTSTKYDVDTSLYNVYTSLYDLDGESLDNVGNRIAVISISKDIMGSGLSPNSVYISGSTYLIQDDGEGNLIDTLNSKYIGNVFYSQGLIVITRQSYLCIFGVAPTTIDNSYSFVNTNLSKVLTVMENDFTDCGFLDYSSFLASTFPEYSFPNYTQVGGIITITPDQLSVIPGEYKLNYTIANNSNIRSNTSSINLTITSQSLNIYNIISSSTCYGTETSTPVTYSINYGVPYYSYSLDGTNYTGVNSLSSITVSGSILSSTSSKVYAKDYFGTVVTSSFSSWYPIPFALTYLSSSAVLCGPTGTTTIQIDAGFSAVSASVNGLAYKKLPNTFDNATTSSTILYKDIYGCVVSSIFNLGYTQPITSSFTTSSAISYGSSTGNAKFDFTNATQNQYYEYYASDYINNPDPQYFGFLPATINGTSSITFPDLNGNSTYTMNVFPTTTNVCSNQYYTNTFTIGQPIPLTFTTSASYQNSCSNAIIYNAVGGIPPYTFIAANSVTSVSYQSSTNYIMLPDFSEGIYNVTVIDSNGAVTNGDPLTVYGRKYVYIEPNCITI